METKAASRGSQRAAYAAPVEGALLIRLHLHPAPLLQTVQEAKADLLERLSQEEALLHVVVGGVGGVDVLHP